MNSPRHERITDKQAVLQTAARLRAIVEPGRTYRFMEFCGGHTHAMFRHGLRALIPPEITLVHGPGCPVCVLPRGRIDSVLDLSTRRPDVTICTYADLLRVPGSSGKNLFDRRAEGGDVRVVYSAEDCLSIARSFPERRVVFLAIGFETTAPGTALLVQAAKSQKFDNLFVYCMHLLTPPAIAYVLEAPEIRRHGAVAIDGFVGPGHVSVIIGSKPYEYFSSEYQKPVVISGFSAHDMLQSIEILVRAVHEGAAGARVLIQYARAVAREGNPKALALAADVFELRKVFEWRGLGQVPYSAFRLRREYASFDAEREFDIVAPPTSDHPLCICADVVRGVALPTKCKLFGRACTPDNPIGPCMVSSEGTCSAYHAYGY